MEKWKETIKSINLAYLTVCREIGSDPKNQGNIHTILGLDKTTLGKLLRLDMAETEKVANIGGLLFRLKGDLLEQARKIHNAGDQGRALSLVSAGLLNEGRREK